MMSKANKGRDAFVARVVRGAERFLGVPPGWWGTWRHVYGPNGERVFYSSGDWTAVRADGTQSRHDSRAYAIKKARG